MPVHHIVANFFVEVPNCCGAGHGHHIPSEVPALKEEGEVGCGVEEAGQGGGGGVGNDAAMARVQLEGGENKTLI